MNLIGLSLEKALKLARKTSVYHQRQHDGRRRGSYKRGVSALPHRIGICLTDDLKQRLDALCARVNVERGLVVRDALALYLKLADQEELAESTVPTLAQQTGHRGGSVPSAQRVRRKRVSE